MKQYKLNFLKENIHLLEVDINNGEILNRTYNKTNLQGYYMIRLRRKVYPVHQVIAVAAGLDVLNKHINHINGIKSDNRISNLEAVTAQENTVHAWETGLNKANVGEKANSSKLTENKVSEIRKLYSSGNYSQRQLGKMFGVRQQSIFQIVNKLSWKHIG